MRGLAHYILAIVVMTAYGGQVCPFVESLNIISWALELLLFFGAAYALRSFLIRPFIVRAPYSGQVRRQLWLELALFLGVGVVVMLFNHFVHGFPFASGVKMILGSITLGFFGALDLSLARENAIALEFARSGQEIALSDDYYPLTRKFAILAITTAVFLALVIFLVVKKDLEWVFENPQVTALSAQRSILIEVSFIFLVILAEIINLVFTYSRNLGAFLNGENEVLSEVTAGNFNRFAVVSTNDEFGYMAMYTNQMIESLSERTRQLQLTQDVTIHALATLAETRDNETGAHILRTQHYVRALAEHLKDHERFREHLDRESIDLLFKSAPLHDIGKVGVPDAILLKPGRLTDDEFELMKLHTRYGRDALEEAVRALGGSSFLYLAQEIAYTHHEKWDGGGYPEQIAGESIPVAGRLMALADVYDALISRRVYKEAFSHEKARAIIVEGRGAHFDPDVVDAFIEIEDEFKRIADEFADEYTEVNPG